MMIKRNSKGQFIKGQKLTKGWRDKIRTGVKKNLPSTAFKKGQRSSPATEFKKGHSVKYRIPKGKHLSPATEFGKGEKHPNFGKFGEDNPNWKDGKSLEIYPSEFNRKLKLKIRTRDNFTCQLCGKTEREELEELNQVLCVNHIDYNKQNCKENNLNTLCLRCNVKVNRKREFWTNYFQTL